MVVVKYNMVDAIVATAHRQDRYVVMTMLTLRRREQPGLFDVVCVVSTWHWCVCVCLRHVA